jgi:predicted Zn-dependent peptidase
VRSVALGLWAFAGSRCEQPEELGITHFVEHMFFKGTKNRDAVSIGQAFNLLGGQFNAFTTQESLCLYARVVDQHLVEALNLLAEMFLESVFPEEEIDRERNVVLEEIKMTDDTPDDHVIDLFQRNLWPDQSLGQPVLGLPKTVRSFRRPHLLKHLKRHLRADRMVIALAGNFDQRRVVRRIASLFSSLPARSSETPARNGLSPRFRRRGVRKHIEQIHFCIGTQAPARAHKDRYALGLASTILGGGMGSRLFEEIREKRGLAYCISTVNGAFFDTGYIGVTGAASPCYFGQVLDLSLREVRRLYTEPVSSGELDRAREQIISQTLFNQESTMSRMLNLAESDYYWQRFLSVDEILDSLAAVTPRDIFSVAEQYLKEKPLCASAVGPLEGALKDHIPDTL